MEEALKNTLIAEKYGLSMKSFFKDCFKYWNDIYIIPFNDILRCKRQLSGFIKNDCNNGFICSKVPSCNGHQFLQFMELMYQFQRYCVLNKKVFFKYFLFSNFTLTTDTIPKIKSWRVIGIFEQQLDNLTFSQKLSYLAIKK